MERINYKRGIIVEEDWTERGEIKIDSDRMGKVEKLSGCFSFEGKGLEIEPRATGTFEDKAIYLTQQCEWVLCNDERGHLCLIPLKKETK